VNLYTFRWSDDPSKPVIEVLAVNAGSAWFSACDQVGALPDDLMLLYVADGWAS
jgi:hypothetical protein